ncbi:MlaC/ttg2D family ABC transporter substrate-binding protein [Methylosarcina fibrata]|uniref:MlaC/ttg2D family ABC transporter substrate-binding protein n=1 Tax=Methylosarcina fibrata TaxID=105972 RepID=UPI0003A989EC|nr:ABC transporter substrate-binding protein [Methylosarcina fibrata]
MKTKQFAVFILSALLMALLPINRAMSENLLPPQQAIQSASDQLQKRLQNPGFSRDFKQITQFVNEVIYPHTDFDRISALVLGKLWKTATPEERGRFKQEFQTLLVRTYSRAFIEFKEWSVRFLPMQMEPGATKVVVKTEVLQPGIQPVGVNYRMFLSNGQWKAYDILIEGVSLVTNYRTTFTNEVQAKGSLAAVIDGLAKRNAEALSAKS